jgi:hypothetical protein
MFTEDVALFLAIISGSALLVAFGHRIPGVPDLLWPERAEELRDAWKQPIQWPRFTIRSIMIAVAVAAVLSAIGTVVRRPTVRGPARPTLVLPPQHPPAAGATSTRLPEIENGEPDLLDPAEAR